MKRTFTLLIGVIVFFMSGTIVAQDVTNDGAKVKKNNVVTNDYNRCGLTIIRVGPGGEKYDNQLDDVFNSLETPGKFDDNSLQTRFLTFKLPREVPGSDATVSVASLGSMTKKKKLGITSDEGKGMRLAIEEAKIGNAVIGQLFGFNGKKFSLDKIQAMGVYNATKDELAAAEAGKRGIAALQDAGEELANLSHILLIDFKNIETMTEYYDRIDEANKKTGKKVERNQNGYLGKATGYLYKVEFTDSLKAVFWNNVWVNEDDKPEVVSSKIKLFEEMKFPLVDIFEITVDAEGTQYNPGDVRAPSVQKTSEELFKTLVDNGLDNVIFEIERLYEPFRVKAPVVNEKPIGAKIGTKEGLKLDQRYFVFENQLDNKGEMKSVRKGVVRSKHVADNKFNVTDSIAKFAKDTSYFYQTAGGKITNGMLMQQRNDLGVGIGFGYSIGEMGGLTGRLEYNLSQLAGSLKVKKLPTAVRVLVEINLASKEYEHVISGSNITFMRISGGLSKDIFFARNFHIAPLVGYGMEIASVPEQIETTTFSTYVLNGGLRVGANLLHNLQAQLTFNYLMPMGTVTLKIGETEIEWPEKWDELFKDRKGLVINVGLRLQL